MPSFGISFSLLSDTTTPDAVKGVTLWFAPPVLAAHYHWDNQI